MKIADREVTVWPADVPSAPLVVFHAFEEEGTNVYEAVKTLTDVPFSFACIGMAHWDDDLSPWAAPAVYREAAPFAGNADGYLDILTGTILPELLRQLPGAPSCRVLAGYSLAGLFSLYAMYRTDSFDRFVSASGSLWYRGFLDYAAAHGPVRPPQRVYLSLGDREAKTRHPVMRAVEENTLRLAALYRQQGIDTVYESNPGNHFTDCDLRAAKGIAWAIGPEKGK